MSNDQITETMIQQQGADKAPRVTPDDLKANIKHVEYVTHVSHSGKILRWCVLTTQCGYAHTGRPSVCVSPENDKPAVGESVAYANAVEELWPLMGYHLQMTLASQQPGVDAITDSDRLAKVMSVVKGDLDSVSDEFVVQVLGFDPDCPEDLTTEQLVKLLDALIIRDRGLQQPDQAEKVFNTEDPDHGEA